MPLSEVTAGTGTGPLLARLLLEKIGGLSRSELTIPHGLTLKLAADPTAEAGGSF
jgi:hypothetical protein